MLRGNMAEPSNGIYVNEYGHESRIQRLETLAIDNSAAIAQQSAQIDSIGKQMVLSLDNVADKVDLLSCNFSDKISDLSNKVQKLDSKIYNSNTRIAALETEEKKTSSFKRFIKKATTPGLAALGTGLATFLIQHFLK